MIAADTSDLKRIEQEAQSWVTRLADADVDCADHDAFDAWLAHSPRHAEAYQQQLDHYYAVASLRQDYANHTRYTRRDAIVRRTAVGVAFAAAAALAIAFVIPREPTGPWSAPVTTQIAEVRDVELPDGSIVTLGADTQMELAFTDAERRVRLSDGEAFFRVAHNAERPFFVETEDAVVRVVGTEFEVKSNPDRVRVTVAQGIVEVSEPGRITTLLSGARTYRLIAGQVVSVSRAVAQEIVLPAPTTQPAAWREGFLVYQDASLAEVIADANRYSRTPITIADPELSRLRITASYPTEQINQMLSSLEATMPLHVERSDDGQTRLVATR
ncbi:FecR family protein [Terricaulis silvestris]|uniref:Fec operon regulator FecR n=1 Tax=Terricaulis silvestris TaxID=2686094 RepID=A0A6I6MK10_9CAUL|nr:FecR domain-containing protein [Terricaulis silvestris]QGZ93528.1 fec operon regulator FecR [Terricaulis silvestris]